VNIFEIEVEVEVEEVKIQSLVYFIPEEAVVLRSEVQTPTNSTSNL
jgi:hypothetical protein